jgi:hypothetical protein
MIYFLCTIIVTAPQIPTLASSSRGVETYYRTNTANRALVVVEGGSQGK